MAQVSDPGRGMHPDSRSPRKVVFMVGLLLTMLGGLFVSFASVASAATEDTVDPITDVATYPQADIFPEGCTVDGPDVLQGVSFAINHEGVVRNVTNLSIQQLFIGDTVTMSWTDYADGCEGIGISLAVKATDHPVFIVTDNQHLVSYQYCSGTDCGGDGEGLGHLTIHVPDEQEACNFQFDAVIGPPLENVGPEGTYYGSSLRGDNGPNMLIDYSNGGKGECIPPTATASQSCTTEGGPSVDVAITNNDDDDIAVVDVRKNGTIVNNQVPIPIGPDAVHISVPFDVDETGTVSVNDTAGGHVFPGAVIFRQEFTFDCVGPAATITHTCAEGAVIAFANNGELPAQLVVKKNGTTVDTVDLAAGDTTSRTYTLAEDETATFRVTSAGFDSGDFVAVHDCVLAESTTTTNGPTTTVPDTVQGNEIVRADTLPRTGSGSTLPLSTVAGLLLMTGGLLLALANRPMPTAATANMRSRGR